LVQCRDICFSYGSKHKPGKSWLLNDVSLELHAGSVYGLLGKNGEGKTTLLKTLCGLRFAQCGTIELLGTSASARDVSVLQQLAFLPEKLPSLPLTARQLCVRRAVFYPNFSEADFLQYLQEFSVNPDQLLQSVSQGQLKKVYIAFNLATNCKILIMDEPANGLDIPSKQIFRRLVAAWADSSRCVLISTHLVRDVEHIIDQILILHNGAIIVDSPLDKVHSCFGESNEANAAGMLYQEKTALGTRSLVAGQTKQKAAVDLEFFFTAAISQPESIASVCKKEAYVSRV